MKYVLLACLWLYVIGCVLTACDGKSVVPEPVMLLLSA